MKTHLLILIGMMSGFAVSADAQEPPPSTPPPVTQPPATPPPATEIPVFLRPAPVALESVIPKTLTGEELTRRRRAIFRMEAVLIDAVKQGARNTAEEIQRFQPGLMMFSSAPVKARGAYLEGYGVFFQVDIPSVIPSVASLVETLGRDALNRERMGSNLAQPTSMSGESRAALINPDAHYVGEVKAELITAMVQFSQSLELLPGEVLVVSARDASEMPGQVAPPSTMTLQVKAADLTDFTAGRISLDEIRKRVQVRGY